MSKTFKLFAVTILAGAASTVYADAATTAGGIKVKTEDGRFEANINGRVHFDYYSFSEDEGATFGSNALTNRGGAAFRRVRVDLSGKAYGWEYKIENDFAGQGTTATGGANGSGFREMWIGTKVGPGKLIIGQHKGFRGMEELASSNEITLIERPNTTATGIYAGRQFLTGLFYKGNTDTFGYGVHATTLQAGTLTTEGHSFGARGYWFPMSSDGQTVHVALAYSSDREDVGSATAAPSFAYGGRRGASLGLGNAGSIFNLPAGTQNGLGTQNTIHGELAGSFGSFTAQAEYAMATLENSLGSAAAPDDLDVTAYYVQASYFVTGEKKVYKKDRGAFGSPKPINSFGAVEAVVRYEASENDAGAADVEGSQITLGANWYVNPNVRFMLNYYIGEAENAAGAKDEPEAITVRAQMSF